MSAREYTVHSRISPAVFRSFAYFDTFSRQKRWRSPLLFAGIMGGFSAICFSQASRLPQAALLGGVLLAVGLLLPAAYLFTFFLSVRAKEKRLRAADSPVAYTLHLTEDGLDVSAGKDNAHFSWNSLDSLFRIKGCICIYVQRNRAYLLPTEGPEEGSALWDWLQGQVPAHLIHDLHTTS